jgi:hypothetical protein
MRAALALIAIVSGAAHAESPLPAQFCPEGLAPPQCGLLPADDHVRRAELQTNKLRTLLFGSYMKCVSRAVSDQAEARQPNALSDCATPLTQRFVTRFDGITSTPPCADFGQLATDLLTLVKAQATKVYCNGNVSLSFGVTGKVPTDVEVERVEFGAWKLMVKEYREITRCYGNGVEKEARGQNADIATCVAKLQAVQDKHAEHFDFELPGFGTHGCFDAQAGTDIVHLLSGIDEAANLNPETFCSP